MHATAKEAEPDDIEFLNTVPIYDVNTPFVFSKRIQQFPIHEFEEDVGPQHNLPSGSSEESYFDLFFDAEIFEHIISDTNKYATYVQNQKRV